MILTVSCSERMLAHVKECLPEEACGLIGGRQGRGWVVYRVENELHSPWRFRMAGIGQLKAFQEMEDEGLELVAIYHSHPKGPEEPSETDLVEFAYPGVFSLIWSPLRDTWQVKAFLMDGFSYQEIALQWVESFAS